MKDYDINKLLEFFNYWRQYTHPTEFYTEGWLTKLLIFSITDFGLVNHDLYITNEYFSEALLYSPFLARYRTDKLAESFTHADGAIGDFEIGDRDRKGSLILTGNDLRIIESKINSRFSKNVTNSDFYNQPARYIACITETIDRAVKIDNLDDLTLGFFLMIPKKQYEKKSEFGELLKKKNIYKTVEKRVKQYKEEADYNNRVEWLKSKFRPVLEKITIKTISYEDIISELEGYKYIKQIKEYYKECIDYNK